MLACLIAVATVISSGAPALANGAIVAARPWHYWVAPFLLIGGVLSLVAWGLTYYFRVVGGRTRRG